MFGMIFSTQQVFVLMAAGHLVADFTLQGWLADAKQKSWWEWMAREKRGVDLAETGYALDYIAALLCHALYWSIAVFAPTFWGHRYMLWAVIINTVVHAVIDDRKANRFTISLLVDQLLHFLQIFVTWRMLILTAS